MNGSPHFSLRKIHRFWNFGSIVLLLALFCVSTSSAITAQSFSIPQTKASPTVLAKSFEQTKNKLDPLDSANTNSMDVYGVVQRVEATGRRLIGGQEERYQRLTVVLDEGLPGSALAHLKKQGQKNLVSVENVLAENPGYRLDLKPGTRILLSMQMPASIAGQQPQEASFSLINVDRTPGLWILGTISILALLIIGGAQLARQGALWFLLTLSVGNFLLTLLKTGQVSAWWSLAFLCALFPLVLSTLETPQNISENPRLTRWRRWVCTLGVWGGSLILLGLLSLMRSAAHLNGYTSEGLIELWIPAPKLDFWGLYISGTLLGFQGFLYLLCRNCLNDGLKAMLYFEADNRIFLSETEPSLPVRTRFALLMQQGRYHLGPLLLGIGFLSLGLSLPITLQFQTGSLAQLLNQESTASALTYFMAGSLSLLLTLPLLAGIIVFFPPKVVTNERETEISI
jgi:uncharacterized membrane protein